MGDSMRRVHGSLPELRGDGVDGSGLRGRHPSGGSGTMSNADYGKLVGDLRAENHQLKLRINLMEPGGGGVGAEGGNWAEQMKEKEAEVEKLVEENADLQERFQQLAQICRELEAGKKATETEKDAEMAQLRATIHNLQAGENAQREQMRRLEAERQAAADAAMQKTKEMETLVAQSKALAEAEAGRGQDEAQAHDLSINIQQLRQSLDTKNRELEEMTKVRAKQDKLINLLNRQHKSLLEMSSGGSSPRIRLTERTLETQTPRGGASPSLILRQRMAELASPHHLNVSISASLMELQRLREKAGAYRHLVLSFHEKLAGSAQFLRDFVARFGSQEDAEALDKFLCLEKLSLSLLDESQAALEGAQGAEDSIWGLVSQLEDVSRDASAIFATLPLDESTSRPPITAAAAVGTSPLVAVASPLHGKTADGDESTRYLGVPDPTGPGRVSPLSAASANSSPTQSEGTEATDVAAMTTTGTELPCRNCLELRAELAKKADEAAATTNLFTRLDNDFKEMNEREECLKQAKDAQAAELQALQADYEQLSKAFQASKAQQRDSETAWASERGEWAGRSEEWGLERARLTAAAEEARAEKEEAERTVTAMEMELTTLRERSTAAAATLHSVEEAKRRSEAGAKREVTRLTEELKAARERLAVTEAAEARAKKEVTEVMEAALAQHKVKLSKKCGTEMKMADVAALLARVQELEASLARHKSAVNSFSACISANNDQLAESIKENLGGEFTAEMRRELEDRGALIQKLMEENARLNSALQAAEVGAVGNRLPKEAVEAIGQEMAAIHAKLEETKTSMALKAANKKQAASSAPPPVQGQLKAPTVSRLKKPNSPLPKPAAKK